MDRLLTLKEVERHVGLKRSAIYERMRAGKFPRPFKLSRRAVRWLQSEIEQWMTDHPRSDGDGIYRAART